MVQDVKKLLWFKKHFSAQEAKPRWVHYKTRNFSIQLLHLGGKHWR